MDEDNPKNIFKRIDKCSWNNFELAADSILGENKNVQIIVIVDNIQHAFKKDEIAAGLMSIFKNMKTKRLNFLYISQRWSITLHFVFYLILYIFFEELVWV